LGSALGIALSYNKYSVSVVSNRSRSKADKLAEVIPGCEAVDGPQDVLDRSDMVFVTTPDDVIESLVAQLRWGPQHSVVHCSGAASIDVLMEAKEAGANTGSLHPFQTFACLDTHRDILKRFLGITFALEAEGVLLENLKTIVQTLGAQYIKIGKNDRALYHASGVMVSGHIVGLINSAMELWQHIGFSRKDSMNVIRALISSTICNVLNQGVERAITGPMVRGDSAMLESHIGALRRDFPELIDQYLSLSKACLPLIPAEIDQDNIKKIEAMLNAK